MKILLVLSLLISSSSFAALAIKPGLWTVEMKMNQNGKEFDPQAKMKEAMAKMTPEKRKQMEEMMAKMSERTGHGAGGSPFGFSDHGMQICYSGEMLKNEEFLNQHKDPQCTTKFPVKTSTRVVTEFNCKNGSSGSAEWIVKDSTHYHGIMKMNHKDGKKTEMNYQASFASADCGKVKPIQEMMSKKPAKN